MRSNAFARSWIALRLIAATLALAFIVTNFTSAANAQATRAEPVAETIWEVRTTWSQGSFYWVFWDNGRYQDTDGPTGSFQQNGDSITLNSDTGFVYRASISGDTMAGVVTAVATGETSGTFSARRVRSH